MNKSMLMALALVSLGLSLLQLTDLDQIFTSAFTAQTISSNTATPASWPTKWIPITDDNNNVVKDADDINGANSGHLDLYYSDAPHGATASIAYENSTCFFRLHLQGNPGSTAALKNATWIVQIKNLVTGIVGGVVLDGGNGTVSVVKITSPGAADVIYKDQGSSTPFHDAVSVSPVWSQLVNPLVPNSSDNYYLDLQVPISALNGGNTQLGIGENTSLQVFVGTSQASQSTGVINMDWMVGSSVSWTAQSTLDLGSLGGGPLPVELTSFHAYLKDGTVDLYWRTETELNNLGFVVLQSEDAEQWKEIGFVAGAGTSQTPISYDFVDRNPPRGSASIFFRLRQIDRDGTMDYSQIVAVQNGIVSAVEITDAFPNPFNPTTTVTFSLVIASRITLSLVDMQGREVQQILSDATLDAGAHAVTVYAGNLQSGRYLVMLRTGQNQHVYPVTLVK